MIGLDMAFRFSEGSAARYPVFYGCYHAGRVIHPASSAMQCTTAVSQGSIEILKLAPSSSKGSGRRNDLAPVAGIRRQDAMITHQIESGRWDEGS